MRNTKHTAIVKIELPDIYSGKLNAKRIKTYKKLAEMYNVSESTIRDIFCKGADFYKNELLNQTT